MPPLQEGDDNDDEEERLRIVGDYKHGSIRRVKLTNFLTYSSVEFTPGPRLNMVVGPNGTGKSTILCAICLGLGGEPRLLGRASDIETFVMNGQDQGEIEIEIMNQEEGERNPIFRRIIRRKGSPKSSFFFNNKPTTGKTVRQTCSTKYNISVDNLCTFLPQDRVGSFSGFDSKQLLIETEKSVSASQALYNTHMELIEAQEELRGGNNKVEAIKEKLELLKVENVRLEREKQRIEERQIALEQAEILEKKIVWLKFEQAREDTLEKREESNAAKERVKQAATELTPIQEKHTEAQAKLDKVDKEYKAMEKEITKHRQNMARQTQKYETHDDQIETTLQELNAMDSHRALLVQKLEQCKENVEQYAASLEEYPSLETLEEEEREALEEHKKHKPEFENAKRELRRIKDEAREVEDQRKAVHQKWVKLQDDKAQRRARIFRQQPNLEKIHDWIQANRELFRKEVVGPIACEVTPKSKNAAAYIEQHLPNAILKSFVVQDKADYDLLYRKVRQEMNIPINIVSVEHFKEPRPRIHSEGKMRILKEKHGVIGYMDESFTAPEVVHQALRAHNVDKVLVGGDKTQQSLDNHRLLDYLAESEKGDGKLYSCAIFSSAGDRSFKYTSNISKYSGKPSVRVDDINPAKWLAPGVSEDLKARVQAELQELDAKYTEFAPAQKEAEQKLAEFQANAQKALDRVKRAKDSVVNLKRMISKLNGAKRKQKEAEDALAVDDDEEKKQKINTLKNRIRHSLVALEAQAEDYKKMMEVTFRCSGIRLNREVLKAEAERLGQQRSEMEDEYERVKQDYQQKNQAYKEARKQLQDLKEEADRKAPIQDENGEDLPLKAELEALPVDSLDEAEEAREEAIQKANSIVANPNALREYERKQKEMEELQTELDNLTSSREKRELALQQKVKPWEAALDRQVAKVDGLFSVYMRELGCTGEVRLKKGNPEFEGDEYGNFRDWGIEIRVSFREGVKPQVLSARVQSGGERSVSTIMYLMAMQEMMVSPFRCVDEINQGLDERNERLVFRRIVENSTQPPGPHGPTHHCGQYFLITPKLLPNLYDMEVEAITVLFIFNGPYNFKDPAAWDVPRLIALRKRDTSEGGEVPPDDQNEGRIPKRARVTEGA